jgi:50S ribosomal subunit-associated GTPase HflX
VFARAERVHTGCRGADGALLQVDTLLAEGVYSRRAASEQARLQTATAELRRVLSRCQREWTVPRVPTVATADSLRAWGPYRTAQLDSALRRYLSSLRGFMKKAALRKPAVS